ncbi:MAG: sigma-70 family RNA polymerase sigma factor [Planctomycetota bacterium]
MAGDRDGQLDELVGRAQRGDREAWAGLYASFGRVVHAIALAHAGAAAADDVTQEVFCSVFAKLSSLRDAAAFPGFLCTAARNHARDFLRRRRRRGQEVPAEELAAAGTTPAEAMERRDAAERVLATIQELPEAYRETLVLRLVGGLSGQEIAARTGLTHGSVRVNLTRGMALLRPLLAAAGLP